jgi:hypothetical protein
VRLLGGWTFEIKYEYNAPLSGCQVTPLTSRGSAERRAAAARDKAHAHAEQRAYCSWGNSQHMAVKHTHPKDCPDHKEAAADRKLHDAVAKKREERQQVLAHSEWFDWYATSPHR